MSILNLQIENIKRLTTINITPDDNLVQITGKNGQGKTSILDSIWWALEGAKNIQVKPIRTGESSARIRIDLGELIVTRTFKKQADGKFTTKILVTNAEGVKIPGGAQTILDGFLDALTFDPLDFLRKKPREQFDLLKQFVPNIDFDKIETDNRYDYQERTNINRDLKRILSVINDIETTATDDTPYIEIEDLLKEIKNASDHNNNLSVRQNNRNILRQQMENKYKQAEQLKKEADEIKLRLEDAPDLPEIIIIDKLNEKIRQAEINNNEISKLDKKRTLLLEAKNLEKLSKKLTGKMENRNKNKLKTISEANLPIENVTFGDECILLNGVPFEQCSSAEQTTASMLIAIARNPKFKVILIKDGSLLDEESEETVRDIAIKHKFQIWQEKVDSSGEIGFYIEEGQIKQQSIQEDF